MPDRWAPLIWSLIQVRPSEQPALCKHTTLHTNWRRSRARGRQAGRSSSSTGQSHGCGLRGFYQRTLIWSSWLHWEAAIVFQSRGPGLGSRKGQSPGSCEPAQVSARCRKCWHHHPPPPGQPGNTLLEGALPTLPLLPSTSGSQLQTPQVQGDRFCPRSTAGLVRSSHREAFPTKFGQDEDGEPRRGPQTSSSWFGLRLAHGFSLTQLPVMPPGCPIQDGFGMCVPWSPNTSLSLTIPVSAPWLWFPAPISAPTPRGSVCPAGSPASHHHQAERRKSCPLLASSRMSGGPLSWDMPLSGSCEVSWFPGKRWELALLKEDWAALRSSVRLPPLVFLLRPGDHASELPTSSCLHCFVRCSR